MPSDLITILAIAGAAAIASLLGGAIAIWRTPTTIFMSLALGYASGVLLATIGFEMMPQAMELGSMVGAAAGFAAGFVVIYAFDLFIHRGQLAGNRSEKHPQVERFHHWRRPRGGEVTVLAGGTSAEEIIEGISIGVGAAIRPGLGVLIGLAIVIDNLSEGLGIGEIIRSGRDEGGDRKGSGQARRILAWTGVIGFSLFASSLIGWFALRGLDDATLGFLFASGAGGMFYLTVTDLVPEAEEHHYQQSAAIAMGVGFLTIFVLSAFI